MTTAPPARNRENRPFAATNGGMAAPSAAPSRCVAGDSFKASATSVPHTEPSTAKDAGTTASLAGCACCSMVIADLALLRRFLLPEREGNRHLLGYTTHVPGSRLENRVTRTADRAIGLLGSSASRCAT